MDGVVEAGPEDVGEAGGGMDHRPCPIERPQAEAEVGVVGDGHAGAARDAHGGEDRIRRARGDRLADARGMQHPGIADHLGGNIVRRHPARRRARAHVGEDMAVGTMRDEIEPGMRGAAPFHRAGVDALLRPQLDEALAELVGADRRDIADARALPRGGDGAVGRVAAVARPEDRLAPAWFNSKSGSPMATMSGMNEREPIPSAAAIWRNCRTPRRAR